MPGSVAVVGLGRVGLPLALSFADRGLDVIGVEREPAVLEQVAAGRMPFHETGTQELLERVLGARAPASSPQPSQDAAERGPHRAHARHARATCTSRSTSRRSARSIDDLLPVLREGHSLILRSTVAPGTTEWVAGYIEQRRGFRVGEDLFVAHVPERIAENHFLEEIATLPCIVGGVGEGSGAQAAELFEVFGTEIVQTTPGAGRAGEDLDQHPALRAVRAAQPPDDGVRAVRRERVRGDRPDQPRLPARRDRRARASPAGACLRKDFAFSEERSSAPGMLLAVSRVHETVPLFLVKGLQGAPGRLAARPQGRRARPHLQARLRRPARLALVQARPPARARAGPRRAPRPARAATGSEPLEAALEGADAVVIATNHSGLRGICSSRLPAGAAARGPVERDRARRGCSRTVRERAALRPVSEPRPRHRRRRHDRRGGGAPAGRATRRLGGARLRPARGARPGCARPARSTPATCATSARRARRVARLHARDPPGGDRRRDRELPQAPAHAARGEQRPLQRASSARRSSERVERLVYVSSSMVFERATEFPTTEEHLLDCPAPRSAYGFSKLAGEVYCRALHDEHGLPVHDLPPLQRLRPGRAARRRAGHRARGARPDPQGARRDSARCRSSARASRRARSPTWTTSPTASSTAMAPPGRRERGLQRLGLRGAHGRRDRRAIIWEACGEDPAEFELEHLPSFEVDVQRRWPSVEKARRLLGWEAQIGPARGDRGHGRVAARARACSRGRSGPRGARPGRRARVRHRRRAASPGATCSTCCPGAVAPSRDELDLLDAAALREALARRARPTTVFHLAALASVGRSWDAPARDDRRQRRR